MSYKHLQEWTHPGNYFGATWKGWAPVVGQHRDSDCVEQSNYAQAYAELGCVPFDGHDTADIPEGTDAVDTRCNHWAVGWVETIYVRLGTGAANKADELLGALEDYPVLDEEDFSEREWDYATEVWRNCFNLGERVDLCREYGVSIFAARHDEIPRDDHGGLFDYLRTP